MPVEAVGYEGTDTDRKPSASIWGRFPDANVEFLSGANVNGFLDGDDFGTMPGGAEPTTEGAWGRYAGFTSTGGAIDPATDFVGGGWVFSSDGDNEGASIRTVSVPVRVSRDYGMVCFETRVKASTIADTKNGFFVGLMDNTALTATSPIAAAGTLADVNLVGFHRLEGDGDMLDTVYKADGVTQVTVQADAVTLVADTFVKVGFKLQPSGDRYGPWILSFYANGTRLTSYKQIPTAAGTDFPNDINMGFVFAVLNATGTTPGNNTIDWWKLGILVNPYGN